MNNTKIVDKFLSNTGLIPNIFGRYSDKMIFSTEKEKAASRRRTDHKPYKSIKPIL